MSIAFGSINTGLPKDIVQKLIQAERIPIQTMEKRKDDIGAKQALLDELIKLTEGLQGKIYESGNARSLRELSHKVDENVVGVQVDKNIAKPGNYRLEVTQLAQKSSAMSSGFEDPDESYIGVGFIQYTLPDGTTQDVYVDSDNASLNGVAKLINSDEENGMSATVINDGADSDAPWRLILSLDETGDEAMAEFPYLYFVDGEDDFYFEFEREAQDAIVKLDGFEVQIPSNRTTDLIPGVTLDLKKADPGNEFTLEISEDIEAVSEKINLMIDNINAVLKFVKDQNQMDQTTDTKRTLGGDITLQSLEGRIRAAVFKDVATSKGFKKLSNLGIRFQRDGMLQFDENTFKNNVGGDYTMVAEVLTGMFDESGVKKNGFIDNLRDTIDLSLRQPDGLLRSRKRTLQSNIDQIDRRIESKERMLKQKEKNLKDRFARLESTISQMKQQSSSVAAIGGGGGGAVMPQLG